MQIMEVLRPSDGGKTLFRDAISAFVQIPGSLPFMSAVKPHIRHVGRPSIRQEELTAREKTVGCCVPSLSNQKTTRPGALLPETALVSSPPKKGKKNKWKVSIYTIHNTRTYIQMAELFQVTLSSPTHISPL